MTNDELSETSEDDEMSETSEDDEMSETSEDDEMSETSEDDKMSETSEDDGRSRFEAYLTDDESEESDEQDKEGSNNPVERNTRKGDTPGEESQSENYDAWGEEPRTKKFLQDTDRPDKTRLDTELLARDSTNRPGSSGSTESDFVWGTELSAQDSVVSERTPSASDYQRSNAEIQVPTQLKEQNHILFLDRSAVSNSDAICRKLLDTQDTAQNLLIINAMGEMAQRIDVCLGDHGSQIHKSAIINFGTGKKTSSASSLMMGSSTVDSMVVENISNPSDLTRLGITASRLVAEWEQETERPISVCFHSLTPLIQHVQSKKVFQFLLPLVQNLGTDRMSAHFHLNPDAHDEQTTRSLYSLFDSVIRITEQGQIEVVPTR